MDERIARIRERVRAQSGPALAQWLQEAEPPLDGNMKAHKFDVDPRASLGVRRAQTEAVAVEYRERPAGDAPTTKGPVSYAAPDGMMAGAPDGVTEAAVCRSEGIAGAALGGASRTTDEMAGAAAPAFEEV